MEDCVAGVVLWFDIFEKMRTSSSGDGTISVFLARLFSTSSKKFLDTRCCNFKHAESVTLQL